MNRIDWTHITLAGACLFGGLAAAQAPVPADQAKATVQGWFAGYEFVPGPTQFKALGPALGPALVAVAQDPAGHPLSRARAVSAMVHAKSELTEQALVALAEDPAAEAIVRRKAVRALAEGWKDRHLSLITNVYLAAGDDVRLREACAKAIRGMGAAGYEVRDLLLRQERDRVVRGLLLETKAIK